ncbi:probable cyclic nucleotide-gated ion channel 20, chloroplastic isoform X3 [Abrus precatorius]|uniref:Probable cyclic nucleotide-gated ion channel 20, chloroplastic isoform X3 n=1 Tax=Abrus precatorius TaxID=3816 RepID=A0A8B8LMT0_ABRPR|nr:probable cyclic nucleotide-gated ion channel 20, chloroplastic isoform X3 [Abrus precatorius]
MDGFEKEEVLLLDTHFKPFNEPVDSKFQRHVSGTKNASVSIPMTSLEPNERATNIMGHTGPLRSQRKTPSNQMSRPLNVSHRPGNHFWAPENQTAESRTEVFSCSGMNENDMQKNYDGKNEHLVRSGQLGMCNDPYCTICPTYIKPTQQSNSKASGIFNTKFHNATKGDAKDWARTTRVVNPHTKLVKQWNKILAICCLVAIFVDPLFFFLLSVHKENKCIVINSTMTTMLVVLRSINDSIHFLNIILQFRLAYVAPESLVVGAGELVDDPKKIAFHYLQTSFIVDLFVVLPLPQRVNQCLRDACSKTYFDECAKFIDCGHGPTEEYHNYTKNVSNWRNSSDASACFTEDGFKYGIYLKAVNLTTDHNVFTRYVYSSFWGFQQISTLAGNLSPSYFVWEVVFTMVIIGSGLLLFALLIGNIQNFLQALGRRSLEMSLRQRDVEQWMSHRRLPEDLRRRVRQAERYNWAATRGVNEGMLLENLPEDLQRDIRRHRFTFVKKVQIFALLDERILDAICERLRQKTYIKGSKILYAGGLVEKVVFIVRGQLESIGEDGISAPLSEGSVCGEELLTRCLEHPLGNQGCGKERIPTQGLVSNRSVCCLTNVDAFSLRAEDLEDVTRLFARIFRKESSTLLETLCSNEDPGCKEIQEETS